MRLASSSISSRRAALRGCTLHFVGGALALAGASCTVVPPTDSASAPSKSPGQPFGDNICFQCTLRACGVPSMACLHDAVCTSWLECVATCATDRTGVAAEASDLRECGLPVQAEALFGCVQDYSTGFLRGCEQACTPL